MPLFNTRVLQFFHNFNKFYAQQFASMIARTGLTMRDIHVLLFLANNPGYDTARDITMLRGISKSQVSQAVDLLAAEGLLDRTPDQQDRRIVHLSITPAGQPLAEECLNIQAQCTQRLRVGLTDAQAEQFCQLLDVILDNGIQLTNDLPR